MKTSEIFESGDWLVSIGDVYELYKMIIEPEDSIQQPWQSWYKMNFKVQSDPAQQEMFGKIYRNLVVKNKSQIITNLLRYMTQRDDDPSFDNILSMIHTLHSNGYKWPELDIISNSINKESARLNR